MQNHAMIMPEYEYIRKILSSEYSKNIPECVLEYGLIAGLLNNVWEFLR